jgi:PIN domain nuclease of toxin-antitoxin system
MILLDTHALIWWVNGSNRLSAPARTAIENERNTKGTILVSAISAWEIAMLVDKGRLTLDRDVADWLDQADLIEGLELVAMDREIGIQSVFLPGDFHKDPADRIIVATARKFASPVVTADERIIAYPHVKTTW